MSESCIKKRTIRGRHVGVHMEDVDYGLYLCKCMYSTIWLFNIAMENDPFIDDIPIKCNIVHDNNNVNNL